MRFVHGEIHPEKSSGTGTTSRQSGRREIEQDKRMQVLDASVVIKWFKPDEKSEAADLLLEAHLAGYETAFAPTLLLYEFLNALHYSKKMKVEEMTDAIERLLSVQLTFANPDAALSARALAIAVSANVSIYDASHVALAQHLRCSLVTADAKLSRAARHLVDIEML